MVRNQNCNYLWGGERTSREHEGSFQRTGNVPYPALGGDYTGTHIRKNSPAVHETLKFTVLCCKSVIPQNKSKNIDDGNILSHIKQEGAPLGSSPHLRCL